MAEYFFFLKKYYILKLLPNMMKIFDGVYFLFNRLEKEFY